MGLTARQRAEGVLAHLRAVGPRSVAELQADLGLTKRETEHALWLLGNAGKVEYVWPYTQPLRYKACA